MMNSKASKLRELLENREIIRLVGAHNGLGAKLIELNGFEGIWASGLEISTSYAVPDANILTMTQYLDMTRAMNDATSLPVVADCDTGFGNSSNVMHLVRQYERAGIAAVIIEDKKFPKQNSLLEDGRQELAPIAEFVGKIMAGKNAQETEEFMFFARVEALIAGWGQEEALKRANAYADAGADGILIHSKEKDPSPIIQFCEAWDGNIPLIVVPTKYPTITEQELIELGVKVVIYANHGMRAAIKAMNDTFSTLNGSGTLSSIEESIEPLSTIFDLSGMIDLKRTEEKFLRSEVGDVTSVILAAGIPDNPKDLSLLLRDTPVAMLDISGRSIMERDIESLRKTGLQQIRVVVGYQSDNIRPEGVERIVNPNYQHTHILDSLMLSINDIRGRVLMLYSDIIFEVSIIDRILKMTEDIILIVDKTNVGNDAKKMKTLDLVRADTSPMESSRTLFDGRSPRVKQIGKNVNEEGADYEFIGIAMFSAKGLEILKSTYIDAKRKYGEGKFQDATSLHRAGFTEIIQECIDNGVEVSLMEVNSGWMEIHSFEDYKTACTFYPTLG